MPEGQDGTEIVDRECNAASNQIGQILRGSLVGNRDNIYAGEFREQGGGEMAGGADPGNCVFDFAGIRFGLGNELPDRLHAHGRIDNEHIRETRRKAHRREGRIRIVGEALENELIDHERGRSVEEHRVADWIAVGDVSRPERDRVGVAAGGERHDDLQRPHRKICGSDRR